MKRMVNAYTISRALVGVDSVIGNPRFRDKLIRWTLLCEQWPTRISWILQLVLLIIIILYRLWNYLATWISGVVLIYVLEKVVVLPLQSTPSGNGGTASASALVSHEIVIFDDSAVLQDACRGTGV